MRWQDPFSQANRDISTALNFPMSDTLNILKSFNDLPTGIRVGSGQ